MLLATAPLLGMEEELNTSNAFAVVEAAFDLNETMDDGFRTTIVLIFGEDINSAIRDKYNRIIPSTFVSAYKILVAT